MTKKHVKYILPEGNLWHEWFDGKTVGEVIELLSKLPSKAKMKVTLAGYGDVESFLYTHREETDEEYQKRLLQEKIVEERRNAHCNLAESRKGVTARIKALQDELNKLGGKV